MRVNTMPSDFQKEMENVLKLDGSRRYTHTIKRVADFEEIWGLHANDGWVLVSDGEHECFPIWPHPEYATLCATNEWAGNEPAAIDLDTWMEKWLPGFEEENKRIAVFPTPQIKGVVVTAERFKEDLNDEIALYE